jgi:hypothetical protein
MTERKRIRNQITAGLGGGISMVAQVFWNPFTRPDAPVEAVWGVRVLLVTAAFVFFHLAWTKYWEYREKYPST